VASRLGRRMRQTGVCSAMIVCLIVPTSCGSRGTAPQIGTITGAEFASVIRKAGVELEKGTTVQSSRRAFFCRAGGASAYIGGVRDQDWSSEFALVLDERGSVGMQERGTAGPEGAGDYFADWDGNGTLEFVWRTAVGAVECTRVIEVAGGAPRLLEIVPALGFHPSFTWDAGGNGVLTYEHRSSRPVVFTLHRNPFRLSVSDPGGALREGWTITGPWARGMSTTTSVSTSAPLE